MKICGNETLIAGSYINASFIPQVEPVQSFYNDYDAFFMRIVLNSANYQSSTGEVTTSVSITSGEQTIGTSGYTTSSVSIGTTSALSDDKNDSPSWK